MQHRVQRGIRPIIGGLAALLLLLSGFLAWSAASTQQLSETAITTFQRVALYQQAQLAVVQEAGWQRLDRVPSSDYATTLAPLDQAATMFATDMQTLAELGDSHQRALAGHLLALNNSYVQAVHNIVAASSGKGDALTRPAEAAQATTEFLYTSVEKSVASDLEQQRHLLAASLATLHTQESIAHLAAFIMFSVAIALIASFWLVVGMYRMNATQATRQERQRLEHVALNDYVTNLGNHRAFQEDLRREVARAQRHGETVALALIDLDDFKLINDQHGHAHGDRILATIGQLLKSGRADDRAFRLGGDEFALILPDTIEQTAAIALERIRRNSEQVLQGATLSVGVAALTPGDTDIDMLREQADAALHEAKHRGRNSVVAFSDIRASASILSATKIRGVRRLLSEGRIGVAFQPIWDLQRGDVVAFEALTRPDPSYGLAGPLEAFDIAEKIGRAPELDALCRHAILSRANELPCDSLLFLNLLPQSLDHALLAGDVLLDEVRQAGLTPDQVVLEITERSLANPAVVIEEAKRLRELGFYLALDDVGSGNSGLEMLRQLPVDFVKIDKTVVADAVTDTAARSVLIAIIAFARESHAFVIAEGIETTTMLDLVQQSNVTGSHNVHGVQGYLLGRPSSTIPTMSELAGYTVLGRGAALAS